MYLFCTHMNVLITLFVKKDVIFVKKISHSSIVYCFVNHSVVTCGLVGGTPLNMVLKSGL